MISRLLLSNPTVIVLTYPGPTFLALISHGFALSVVATIGKVIPAVHLVRFCG